MNAKVNLLFREGLQYFEQFIAQRSSYIPRPIEAALYLTKKCNSRCSMCNFWKNTDDIEDLHTKKILSLVDDFQKMGVVILSLSAEGEITLRKDFHKIIQKVYQNNFLFSINSNFLTVSEEIIRLFLQCKPYQITVGIDSLNSEKYTSIRGVENGLHRVLSNVKKVNTAGYTNIAFGTIILNNNLDDLIDLVNYVIDNKLMGIRFTAFQPLGFGKRWSKEELNLYTDEKYQIKLVNIIEKLVLMKQKGAPIINSIPYLKAIPNSFKNPIYFPIPCHIPNRRIHVSSNGDVSLCQVMEGKAVIGNVSDGSLRNIWYSEKARHIRDVVRNKKCGGCWLSCYQETNIRFSNKHGFQSLLNAGNRYFRMK